MPDTEFPAKGKPLQLALARLNAVGQAAREATPQVVRMDKVTQPLDKPSGVKRDREPTKFSPDGYALGKQQNYRRLKRARDHMQKVTLGNSKAETEIKYRKPLDEWDAEELARGRVRDRKGGFTGSAPKWISGEIHEEAMDRFTSIVKTGMRVHAVDALTVIGSIINNEEIDNRGRPQVAPSTKLQAAQFLIEHVVGKPTQRVEQDISVKLQGILASVMVNPNEAGDGYTPGHLPGITMQLAAARGADDDEVLEGGDG